MTLRLATHPDVAHRWPGVRDGLGAAAPDTEAGPVIVDPVRSVFPPEADLVMVGLAALRRPGAGDLHMVAVPPRGDVRDVLVTRGSGASLRSLRGGARVGVEGARRTAFLGAHRPDLIGVPLASAEAVAEVSAGRLDAAILAVEAARLLDTGELGMEILDPRAWLPEPGQGIVALVSRRPHAEAAALDHAPTRAALEAELALMEALDASGGAIGAVAQASGRSIRLWAAVASPDGRRLVRADLTGVIEAPDSLGVSVARLLSERGAAQLLRPSER